LDAKKSRKYYKVGETPSCLPQIEKRNLEEGELDNGVERRGTEISHPDEKKVGGGRLSLSQREMRLRKDGVKSPHPTSPKLKNAIWRRG